MRLSSAIRSSSPQEHGWEINVAAKKLAEVLGKAHIAPPGGDVEEALTCELFLSGFRLTMAELFDVEAMEA